MIADERWTPPDNERVSINIHPQVRNAIHHLLSEDPELHGVGYSEFIMRSILSYQRRHDARFNPYDVEHLLFSFADRVKVELDRLPTKRIGWLTRWNYVRRVDAYDAVDRASNR